MKVLVTGGAGFIGTALSRCLVARGDAVTVADLVKSSLPSVLTVPVDVRDRNAITTLVAHADLVVHLASKVGVTYYLTTHRETLTTIVEGTANVVDACVASGVPLVMTSTSEVYGKGVPGTPMRELDDLHFGPTRTRRWVYGMAKALAEQIAIDAYEHHTLPVTIIRPFNVVGPGQHPAGGLVFPSFVAAAAAGAPLTIHGDGRQCRTFCGIDDFLNGVLKLLTLTVTEPRILNLGSRQAWSIREVAQAFLVAAERDHGIRLHLRFVPYNLPYGRHFEDTRSREPDLSLAETLIDWDSNRLVPMPDLAAATLAATITAMPIPDRRSRVSEVELCH